MKNKFIVLILIVTVFGLMSGVVGQMISRAYFFENDFNMPFFGDISFRGDNFNGPNLIIRNPKKIIVDQEVKSLETLESVKPSIMGIFASSSKDKVNGNFLDLREIKGQAFVITSDGWTISSFTPLDILNIKNREATSSREKILKIAKKYVFLSSDLSVYEVENILYDSLSKFSFWKLKAHDLPVRKLESFLKNGDLVFGINWQSDILTTTVLGNSRRSRILSSDVDDRSILLSDKINANLNNSFLFNVYGDLIAFIVDDKKIIPISYFNASINNLLKNKSIKRPSFGVNYINNFNIFDLDKKKTREGAVITKDKNGIAVLSDSPAEKLGLKEGDIIISINQNELSKDINLQEMISGYLPGDELLIDYLREGKNNSLKLILSAF